MFPVQGCEDQTIVSVGVSGLDSQHPAPKYKPTLAQECITATFDSVQTAMSSTADSSNLIPLPGSEHFNVVVDKSSRQMCLPTQVALITHPQCGLVDRVWVLIVKVDPALPALLTCQN